MAIRFVVLAHDDAPMLRLLCQKLSPNPVWVHLDKAVDMESYLRSADGTMPKNVTFVRERYDVHWGGYSVVDAMRSCGTAAIKSGDPEDHVVFLSGHCYPVRQVEELATFLASSPRRQFARAYRLKSKAGWHTDRYELRHWFDLNFPIRLPASVRRLLRFLVKQVTGMAPRRRTTLEVVAGSQWMALTVGCLEEALASLDLPIYAIFRNSFAPDEMAIQSFIHNSRWASDTQAGGPELLLGDDISALPNLHYLRPAMFGAATVEDLCAAQKNGAFFIRKVDSKSSLIQLIDAYQGSEQSGATDDFSNKSI